MEVVSDGNSVWFWCEARGATINSGLRLDWFLGKKIPGQQELYMFINSYEGNYS